MRNPRPHRRGCGVLEGPRTPPTAGRPAPAVSGPSRRQARPPAVPPHPRRTSTPPSRRRPDATPGPRRSFCPRAPFRHFRDAVHVHLGRLQRRPWRKGRWGWKGQARWGRKARRGRRGGRGAAGISGVVHRRASGGNGGSGRAGPEHCNQKWGAWIAESASLSAGPELRLITGSLDRRSKGARGGGARGSATSARAEEAGAVGWKGCWGRRARGRGGCSSWLDDNTTRLALRVCVRAMAGRLGSPRFDHLGRGGYKKTCPRPANRTGAGNRPEGRCQVTRLRDGYVEGRRPVGGLHSDPVNRRRSGAYRYRQARQIGNCPVDA